MLVLCVDIPHHLSLCIIEQFTNPHTCIASMFYVCYIDPCCPAQPVKTYQRSAGSAVGYTNTRDLMEKSGIDQTIPRVTRDSNLSQN